MHVFDMFSCLTAALFRQSRQTFHPLPYFNLCLQRNASKAQSASTNTQSNKLRKARTKLTDLATTVTKKASAKLKKSQTLVNSAASEDSSEDIEAAPQYCVSVPELIRPVVLSIDIGTRNFAYCRMDANMKVLDWGVWDLVKLGVPGVVPAREPDIHTMHALTQTPMFSSADKVLIESQIVGKMKTLEAVLHAFMFTRATVVRPFAVHKHFGTTTGKYRTNKQLAVGLCLDLSSSPESAFLATAKKRDDLADAYLLARYGHEASTMATTTQPLLSPKRARSKPTKKVSVKKSKKPKSAKIAKAKARKVKLTKPHTNRS